MGFASPTEMENSLWQYQSEELPKVMFKQGLSVLLYY